MSCLTPQRTRPLILRGDHVELALDGHLTQLRVLADPQPRLGLRGDGSVIRPDYYVLDAPDGQTIPLTVGCKYRWVWLCPLGGPCDRLWVRETWQLVIPEIDWETRCAEGIAATWEGPNPPELPKGWRIWYDTLGEAGMDPDDAMVPRWRPSTQMPKWASRLTLEIQEVRLDRLLNMTHVDADQEGHESANDALSEYRYLWDLGPEDNPWTWVVKVVRVEG